MSKKRFRISSKLKTKTKICYCSIFGIIPQHFMANILRNAHNIVEHQNSFVNEKAKTSFLNLFESMSDSSSFNEGCYSAIL